MDIEELRAKIAAEEAEDDEDDTEDTSPDKVVKGKGKEKSKEEEDADDLWQALILLTAASDALKAVSYLDRTKDFLTHKALGDVESLIAKVDELVEQYDITGVDDDGDLYASIAFGS